MSKPERLRSIEKLLKKNPIIYQYISIEGAKLLLKDMTIMVKNPIKFNDPNDCDLRLLNFNSAKKEHHFESIKKFNSSTNNQKIEYETLTDKRIKEEFEDKVFPEFLKTIGIACFSKKSDNSLMWSHYTYGHEGICIGFDLTKLYFSLSSVKPKEIALIEVAYAKKFKSKDYFKDRDDAIHYWIKTKSKIWKYEKEVRILFTNLIFNQHKKVLIEFDKTAISEIILGCNIELENENWIKNISKEKSLDINLYKMEKVQNSFELKPKSINP